MRATQDGPEPRAEPRVEHILVLPQVGRRERHVTRLLAGHLKGFLGGLGHDVSPLREIVCRYALAPPQLARDAPVLDVLHPVAVCVLVFRGDELYRILHDGACRRLGYILHRHEPLHRELGLDGRARTLRVADVVGVWLDLLHEPRLLEVGLDHAAALEAVHAHIEAHLVVDGTVIVEYVDRLERIFLAQHVVVHVVRGRHLQCARTELYVYVRVADYWYRASHQRHDDAGIGRYVLIPFVVGVEADGRIAQNGLGARGGHHEVAVRALDHVTQVVELALRLLVYHLLVRKGRLGCGVPMHHAHAAVYFPLVVEVDENLYDTLGAGPVHGEACAVPVARGAQLAQLLEDDAAVFLLPLPCVAQELLAREARLVDALGLELGHNLGLGGDGGMVGTGDPAGVLALLAGAAHQYVLQRVVEHVPHMEHTRHVGGRDDYRVGFAGVGLRMEKFVVDPILVPLRFDLLWRVLVCYHICYLTKIYVCG